MKFKNLMALSLATSLTVFSAGNALAGADMHKSTERQKMEDTGRDIQDSSARTYDELRDDASGTGAGASDEMRDERKKAKKKGKKAKKQQREEDSEMGKLRGTGRDILDSSKETGRRLKEDVRGSGSGEE